VRKEEREALRKGYTSVSMKGKDVKKVGLYTLLAMRVRTLGARIQFCSVRNSEIDADDEKDSSHTH
jgi:hypothetical protein